MGGGPRARWLNACHPLTLSESLCPSTLRAFFYLPFLAAFCSQPLVPTLQRGNPVQDALRSCDAERRQLRAHAERGHEKNPW